jgi:hypothetical protein
MMLALLVCTALADEPASEGTPGGAEAPAGTTPADAPPSDPAPSSGFPSEDDMFGGDTPAAPPATPTEAPVVDDVEIKQITNKDIADTIGRADERLTIGGQIWLQFQASLAEEGEVAEVPLTSPSFADFYADARPNDRIRGYLRVRFVNDFTVARGDTTAFGSARAAQTIGLDQFWLKFDAWKKVFFTVGKQRIRWGTGRFWNPTDFMQSQRLDGLAVFDVRLGVPLVKVHVPIESTGTNLYALANIDAASNPGEIGLGLRAEQVVGSSEVSVSALIRNNQPLKLGADVSAPVGPFDVKLEGAVVRGTEAGKPHWQGEFSATELPTEAGWDDRWIPQVVAATEVSVRYSDEDSVSFGAEYFYNGAGYKDASLYPWLLFNSQFSVFYLGQHYLAVYGLAANPGRLRNTSFVASFLGNLSDRSYVTRADWRVTANSFLNLNTYAQYHFGDTGEFHYGLQVDPIPGVQGLENGLDVPAPLFDLGFGAQITF